MSLKKFENNLTKKFNNKNRDTLEYIKERERELEIVQILLLIKILMMEL
jgi:hypothetical protein